MEKIYTPIKLLWCLSLILVSVEVQFSLGGGGGLGIVWAGDAAELCCSRGRLGLGDAMDGDATADVVKMALN